MVEVVSGHDSKVKSLTVYVPWDLVAAQRNNINPWLSIHTDHKETESSSNFLTGTKTKITRTWTTRETRGELWERAFAVVGPVGPSRAFVDPGKYDNIKSLTRFLVSEQWVVDGQLELGMGFAHPALLNSGTDVDPKLWGGGISRFSVDFGPGGYKGADTEVVQLTFGDTPDRIWGVNNDDLYRNSVAREELGGCQVCVINWCNLCCCWCCCGGFPCSGKPLVIERDLDAYRPIVRKMT